ncbi:MAG: sugar transferase [Bacteroidales bacterium]|jgi:O-antigen biosynthesis protein WbqP|nr:sugar transferase [Bacteroidales bacterium]
MYSLIKRIVDFGAALMMIIFFLPLFMSLYVALKLDSQGPVFFKQKRVGIHKTHFNILKYRTMSVDAPKDIPTHLLEAPHEHITKVGKFLRRYSIDELPQLFNILMGHMSFVGPRPALWNQYDLIEERDKYGANDVPVGLTGWAQVNGRDELSIEAKAKLDGDYVAKRSLTFDIHCIVKTFLAVSTADGMK